MVTRLIFILFLSLTSVSLYSQTPVALNIDRNVMTEELLSRFTASITSGIDEQLQVTADAGINKALDETLIREMLVPYKDYGINPDDREYYSRIKEIYTAIKTDPNYDPRAEVESKIRTMIDTRISNYAKSFIDEESQEIYGQLKALFDDANKKIQGLLEATERMYELPPDDPEIETKWKNELIKLGISGKFTDMLGDLENMFGQAQAKYGKPIEMAMMIKEGLSTKDPTNKIEILFDFGEKFGEDLPLVGTIVSSLFTLGKEVLAAAKRAGGILERNLGQGCISSDGEYVQGASIKQKFYQSFPHIERACPLSQSTTAGVYQNIYFNTSSATELLFYSNKNWLGSAPESQDGTHAGDGDIGAIRAFLKSKGESGKAEDIVFLHSAYIKSPGFLDYRKKLNEKFDKIRVLSNRTYSMLSHCEDEKIEAFMMDKIGMNWLSKLMKDGSKFDFGTIKIFTQSAISDLVDQMLTNRYLSRNNDNLDRLDEIIENLEENIPITISGTVTGATDRNPLIGAKVTADIPMLFEGAACVKNITNENGRFSILLNVPGAYEGKLGFTANYAGVQQTKELTVSIKEEKRYEVNFFLEVSTQKLNGLIITPQQSTLKVGESVAFKVIAYYPDGREEDVTLQALTSHEFTAQEAGQFKIMATFLGKEALAIVVVEDPEGDGSSGGEPDPDSCDPLTQRWNEELEKCDCLPPLLENNEGECVDPEELEDELGEEESACAEKAKELVLLLAAASQLNEAYIDHYRVFLLHNDRFYKEINDRAADPCQNLMIGYTYYTALNAANRMKALESELVSILIDITYVTTVCAELTDLLNQGGFGSDVTQWVEFFDVSASLSSMTDRLVEVGCNVDDVAQSGESVAPGELDPTFVGQGGTSTEIAGDGKDNDGDGLQDETTVVGLPGYNITIGLYDSGSAKDDVFNLSVQGLGSLGLTPAGGLRTYGLSLPPGTYWAEVLVVDAPDDIGTFTITILQNGISIGALTGEPGEGSVSRIVFDVTE